MRINIWGYGGELVVGSIAREQYVYWSMQDEEQLNEHVLGYSEDEIDPSLSLGEWYELDNLEHLNGAGYDFSTHITVESDDGTVLFEKPITDICEIEGCDKVVKFESGYDSDDTPHEFVFMAYSSEKGSFGNFEVPGNDFDPSKLQITVRMVEGFHIVDGFWYDHPKTVDLEDSSTNGKSWECWLFKTKQEPDQADQGRS